MHKHKHTSYLFPIISMRMLKHAHARSAVTSLQPLQHILQSLCYTSLYVKTHALHADLHKRMLKEPPFYFSNTYTLCMACTDMQASYPWQSATSTTPFLILLLTQNWKCSMKRPQPPRTLLTNTLVACAPVLANIIVASPSNTLLARTRG